jgi:probable HAF family extracellular repeat protein
MKKLLFLLPFCMAAAAHAAPQYYVHRLGTNAPSSITGINNLDQVIGTKWTAQGTRAYVWQNSYWAPVAAPSGSDVNGIQLSGINDSGALVGFSYGQNFESTGFRSHNGQLTTLPMLEPGTYGDAQAINNAGQAVGAAAYTDGTGNLAPTAVLYANGTVTRLVPGTLSRSAARDINDAGTIVGEMNSSGFMIKEGVYSQISYGGNETRITAVNNQNVVAGTYFDANGFGSFLYHNGLYTPLDTFGKSWTTSLNNAGQVVGGYGNDQPYLYDNGVMYDLNSLIDPGAGLTIKGGGFINDRGNIATYGCDAGSKCVPVLLSISPVPEPAHWAMLLGGLGLLGALRVSRRTGIAA